MDNKNILTRIESKAEIIAYVQNLNYALVHGACIDFQKRRLVDESRNIKYTNKYTIPTLFPDDDPVDALRRELLTLTVEDYIRTVQDLKFPKRSEMREFGKVYNEAEEVYIKIRVEVLGQYGSPTVFVMSFHFAEDPFNPDMFPHRKITEV